MRHAAIAALCATVLGALLALSPPAQAELLVNVSKSQQRLAVTLDGTEIYRWPVSTGVRGYDTPSGSYRPHDIERHWYSRQYGRTPMPWAVFFHRGYAVHGTTEAHNLGRAASHGCVRLRPDNASILYSLVRRQGLDQTKVVVMNGPLPGLPGAMSEMEKPPACEDATGHFAKADDKADDKTADGEVKEYGAKARSADVAPPEPAAAGKGAVRIPERVTNVDVHRVSVGGSEAKILRERQTWLRGLDRKYGFK